MISYYKKDKNEDLNSSNKVEIFDSLISLIKELIRGILRILSNEIPKAH